MLLPDESGAEIDNLLQSPELRLRVADFVPRFLARVVDIELPPLRDLPVSAAAEAVRGAVGHALLAQASPPAKRGEPCPWKPACALDVLWRDRPLTRGMPIPKPVSFAVRADTSAVSVRIVLFGLASAWAMPVADAAVRAINGGIKLRNGPDLPTEISARQIRDISGLRSQHASFVNIDFKTPLRWRVAEPGNFDPASFVLSLANRVSGIARWHGVVLEEEWHCMRALCQSIGWDVSGMRRSPVVRRSGRQNREFATDAWEGAFSGAGQLGFLADLLLLGGVCNAGSSAALGYGRYELQYA